MEKRNNECRIQNGVSCPKKSPWPSWVGKVTGIPFFLIAVFASYVLYQTNVIVLAVWIVAFVIFLIPLRYLVCARCIYYGQDCSTTMGKTVPLLFKKQEGKSILLGLWLDIAFFAFLFLLPIPGVFCFGGWLLFALWCGTFFLAFIVITRLGCSYCPFTFCPIGKAGKSFWGLFGKRDS
jgi:hypothetical protein